MTPLQCLICGGPTNRQYNPRMVNGRFDPKGPWPLCEACVPELRERLKEAQCQCCGAHRPACMCYSSLANRMERTASGQIHLHRNRLERCSPEAHGRPYPEPLESLFLEEVHMASQ
jgi:hypothetical protein